MKDIVLFKSKDNEIMLEVNLKEDTVWLTQKQMGVLFDRDSDTIGNHIQKIFQEGELDEVSVTGKFPVAAKDGKVYITQIYNLDVIISVGYRVKSQRGTQFRIWATNVLRDYLVNGYKINEKRLQESNQKYLDLQKTISVMDNVLKHRTLKSDEAEGLLKVIADYNYALSLFDRYDKDKLTVQNVTKDKVKKITYKDIVSLISMLRQEIRTGDLFGQERNGQLDSIVKTIYQTFEGKDLYASIEEKAANLLYFIIKDHPFADGNKRIASASFLQFLNLNNILYTSTGGLRIANNTLVALALMIAESNPQDRDIILKVVVNLINRDN